MVQVVRLKHVKATRYRGRVYWYHRLTKERLPDDPNERAARVLEINATLDGWRNDVVPGSLAALISHYRASPDYKRLAPSTRESYLRDMDLLCRNVPDKLVSEIDRAWLYAGRNNMADTPRAADKMLTTLSILMNFAVDQLGWRADNPVRGVRKLRGGESYEPWPEAAIQRFRAQANPRMVWAMELALYTGQRRGDVLAMQWRHIRDGAISVTPGKTRNRTGKTLVIPLHPHLAAVLDGIPRVGTNIVHRKDGRAYTGDGFASIFQREKKRLGLDGLQFHGLRHTLGRMLAEAGRSEREIMAVLGHETAAMATRYTQGADQERLARSAIEELESRTKVTKLRDRTVKKGQPR